MVTQRYWFDDGHQNTIQSRHTNAVNATSGMEMRRASDNDYACAKYKADCGNPTASGSEESETLKGVPDPVDSIATIDSGSGMSQNGTHAWELSGYDGAAPWDYRQMFTHYYANIYMYGLSLNRWTWLDADTAGGTRHGNYYGSFAHTPRTVQTGKVFLVPFHIQNTSHYDWNDDGANLEHLSYHWYTSDGSLVTWDGLRTSLGRDVPPADDPSLQASVVAPFKSGTYTLKWDIVTEGIAWFSTQYYPWTTQDVTVNVQQSPGMAFLPDVTNSGGWVSTIVVRNNSTSNWASADVSYVTTGGNVSSSSSYLILSKGTINATPPSGFSGSAVVAANQDVSVVVENQANSERERTNYTGILPTASQSLVGMANEASLDGRYKKGYSSFQDGSRAVYGPLVYRTYSQNGYTWNAGITVQNLSTQQATVNLYYYNSDGSPAGSQTNQAIAGRGMSGFVAPQNGFKGVGDDHSKSRHRRRRQRDQRCFEWRYSRDLQCQQPLGKLSLIDKAVTRGQRKTRWPLFIYRECCWLTPSDDQV